MISKSQIKKYKSLKLKKYRYLHKKFLIEGINLCEAALKKDAEIDTILISDNCNTNESITTIQNLAASRAVPVEFISNEIIETLSDSDSPQGIIAVVFMRKPGFDDLWKLENSVLILLDQIRDPGNLGTILRTASWFGVQAILLSDNCVDLYNAKVLRSTAGAIFELNMILEQVNIQIFIRESRKRGYKLFVTVPSSSVSYTQVKYQPPFILVIGNERRGVDERIKAVATSEFCIPKKGHGNSLNAAVTAGILLSEIFRN